MPAQVVAQLFYIGNDQDPFPGSLVAAGGHIYPQIEGQVKLVDREADSAGNGGTLLFRPYDLSALQQFAVQET